MVSMKSLYHIPVLELSRAIKYCTINRIDNMIYNLWSNVFWKKMLFLNLYLFWKDLRLLFILLDLFKLKNVILIVIWRIFWKMLSIWTWINNVLVVDVACSHIFKSMKNIAIENVHYSMRENIEHNKYTWT